MILKIIPLTRLPRAFSTFDYQINKELENSVEIGQLLKIPFRNKEIFGIIFSIEKKLKNEKLKSIIEIVNKEPLFSSKQLLMYLQLSEVYLTSLSVFLKMAVLPLQKRKLKKITLKKNNLVKRKEKSKTSYHLYNSDEEREKMYNSINKITLIIVPEVQQIQQLKEKITKKLQPKITTWYSELSNKEKFENWLDIKNGEKTIIIGTRNALFLPFNNLDKIIIDFEHDENLKNWDSNPKFHSKDIVKFLQKLYSCDLVFTSFSPSFEKYYEINKGQITLNKKLDKDKLIFKTKKPDTKRLPNLITYNDKNFDKQKNIFSLDLEDKIKNSTKDVFIYINRRGYATSVICSSCNFVESDPKTGLPLIYNKEQNILYSPYTNFTKVFSSICPKCHKEMSKLYGYGTETVLSELTKLLKNKDVDLISIDKDSNQVKLSTDKQNIIVGTTAAFKSIDWSKTELIIFLDIDRQLAIPEYLAVENVWHSIQEIQFHRTDDSSFYIQTSKPDHTIFKSLGEKDRIYRTDLGNRLLLGLFPYKYIVKYYYGSEEESQSKLQIKEATNSISSALTKIAKDVTILGPYEMQPKYFRRKYYYGFALKIAENNPFLVIRQINQQLPNNFKIDPNPINLLSP